MLRIAEKFSLPVDTVTQAIGILAKRRAGKSYLTRRLVEQLAKAHQQVVIVDPKGDWWGIRGSADKKSPGLPMVIIGGSHGHVPLEANAGEVVANLVVKERVNLVLDLSDLRKGEIARFMGGMGGYQGGFLEAVYRLKAHEEFRTPMCLVLDEADAIAPQKPQKGEERMLGAAEDIVRRGGQRGIGCIMVTQRAAVLNKNVLTQMQILICLRTIAPQDLKAAQAWIDVHGTPEQRATLLMSLPSLPVGDAWFWSPGWPDGEGIFERVHVLPIETFDSFATPKPGEKRVEPKNLAEVDLGALTRQMAETIERAKANDPDVLRAEIAKLKKELAYGVRPRIKAGAVLDEKAIEAEVQKRTAQQVREHWRAADGVIRALFGEIADKIGAIGEQSREVRQYVSKLNPTFVRGLATDAEAREPKRAPEPARSVASKFVESTERIIRATPRHRNGDSSSGATHGGVRKVLEVLAQEPDKEFAINQIMINAAMAERTVQNYLSSARQDGLVEGFGSSIRITPAGLAVVGPVKRIPLGDERRKFWRDKLPSGESRVFEVACNTYPGKTDVQQIVSETGMAERTVQNYLSALRTRKLIIGFGSNIQASAELFG